MAATAARDLAVPAPRSTRPRIGDDVYDRDDSLKESTNPKSLPGKNHNHNGASQRFSGNLKPTAAPIIGVSGNLGQGQLSARRHHRPPAMFPKKANTGGGGREPKTAVPEPGSPKVSCIGKVLSGRERARPRHRSPTGGCCLGLGFSIRRSRSRKSAVESVDWSPPPRIPRASVERRRESVGAEVKAALAAPAPALGGMRRFASGRRGADWTAGMQDGGRVAWSGPL